jgi:hypothetical protein
MRWPMTACCPRPWWCASKPRQALPIRRPRSCGGVWVVVSAANPPSGSLTVGFMAIDLGRVDLRFGSAMAARRT